MSKKKQHPLETVFDMEEGTTDFSEDYAIATPAPTTVAVVEKDEEDIELDKRIDAVYDAAIEAYQNQSAYTEIIEPRYAARNAEVAANYLTIALQAATSKAKIKTDRKKAGALATGANAKTTNNLIVADRNEILKMIQVDDEDLEL
jgi:hypothetical protein